MPFLYAKELLLTLRIWEDNLSISGDSNIWATWAIWAYSIWALTRIVALFFSRTQKSHGVNVLSNSEIPYCWQASTQPTLPVQNNGGTQEENSKYLYV